MTLDLNPDLLQLGGHFTTKILQRIERRQWNVALFVSDVIALVAIPILPVGIPDRLGAIQRVTGCVPIVVKMDLVKYKELRLRSKIDRVRNAGEFKVALRAPS